MSGFDPGEGDAIDSDLFTPVGDGLALRGSRCDECGAVAFPAQQSCARCAGVRVQPLALAGKGSLWAHTVQRFAPKPPYLCAQGAFRPYAVGYVELGGVVTVEGRIVGDPDQPLSPGTIMRVVAETLVDAAGVARWTFAFETMEGAA